MRFEIFIPILLMSLPLLALLPGSVSAATFDVGTVSGFQNALDTAGANGENDIINVSGGNYAVTTTLRYWSSEEFTLTVQGMSGEVAILDGGGSTQIMELISASASGHLTVSNLDLRNGSSAYGGAVYAETEAATISIHGCEFYDNFSTDVGGAVNSYSQSGNILVSECRFQGNDSGRAGGLFAQTETGHLTSLTSCHFEDNSCTVDGGGTMLYPLGSGASLMVEDNTFIGNQATNFGGGCWSRLPAGNSTVTYNGNGFVGNVTLTGDGAGTYLEFESGDLSYSNNTYYENDSGLDGGGMWMWNGTGTMNMTGNVFSQNRASANGGGASLITDMGTMAVSRTVFDTNESGNVGGGLNLATTGGMLGVEHSSFYSNVASEGGGIYCYFDQSGAQAGVSNTILWNDAPQGIAYSGAQSPLVTFSDVENGASEPWFGEGCIDADPLFANPSSGDFQITWDSFPVEDVTKSPCIDAGDPSSQPDLDGTVADMGAFFFAQGTGGDDEPRPQSRSGDLELCQPNPFFAATTITYSISEPSVVRMSMYDITGRLVDTVIKEHVRAGNQSLVWNASGLSPGAYICKLNINERPRHRQLIIIKKMH